MKNILSILFLLVILFDAKADNLFELDVREHTEKVFSEKTYFIFNHNSARWDLKKRSVDGMINVLELAKNELVSYESILIVDPESMKSNYFNSKYYLDSDDVTYTAASASGAHKLRFPNAEMLIFSGGDLSMCLCESLRDSVRGVNLNNKELDIVIVSDAVYADTFFINGYRKDNPLPQETFNLLEIFEGMKEYQIRDYLKTQIIRNEKVICPLQSRSMEGELDISPYKFTFIKDGKKIDTLGTGSKDIRIHFVKSKELSSKVEDIKKCKKN